jgi:hypothetical protein
MLAILSFLCLTLVSCSRSTPTESGSESETGPQLVGSVWYNGQPVQQGMIVFAPDSERGGRGPLLHAELQGSGQFHLPAKASQGWHRISLAGDYPQLPAHLRNPALSGLSWEIQPKDETKLGLRIDISANQVWNVGK